MSIEGEYWAYVAAVLGHFRIKTRHRDICSKSNGRHRRHNEEYSYDQHQKQPGRTRHKAIQDSSRFEHDPPSLKDREKDKRGKLIKFCKNNDELFTGLAVSLSNKMFPTFESLLEHLNSKIPTPSGVMYVFSSPEYEEITTLAQLEADKVYIVSSSRKIAKHIDYDKVARGKKGTDVPRKSGQKARRPNNKSTSPPSKKTLILVLISNLARDSVAKMLLNPKTNQNFEDMVDDLGSLLKIPKQPVTGIYGAEKPHRKIESYSQLFRELNEHDTFLVCGDEGIPVELMPSSGKSESVAEVRSNTRSQHRRKRPRKQNENEDPTPRYQNQQEEEPTPRGRKPRDTVTQESRRSVANTNYQSMQEDAFTTENVDEEEEEMPNYGSANNSDDDDYQM